MRCKEYGKEHRDVIIFLHGGGLNWWQYGKVAMELQDTYHIVIPTLDGHAQSLADFTTIEAQAEKLIRYIDEKHGGRVMAICGVSLGAQVLLEMLVQRPGICRYALVESANVRPSKITRALIAPAILWSWKLVELRWFAKMQAKYLRIPLSRFERYFEDTNAMTRENMIAILQASVMYEAKESLRACGCRVHVMAAEHDSWRIKRSAKQLASLISGSKLHRVPMMHHGEFPFFSITYAETIRCIVTGKEKYPFEPVVTVM